MKPKLPTAWSRFFGLREASAPAPDVETPVAPLSPAPVGVSCACGDMALLRREMEILKADVKNLGYELALDLEQKLPRVDTREEPRSHSLLSKPTTQADIESPWFAHWCRELKIAPRYHRKAWEVAFVVQALYEANVLVQGKRGLGFGCGEERLPSFFASRGIEVVASDSPPEKSGGQHWQQSHQYAVNADVLFFPNLVSEADFTRLVRHEFIDMNHIPQSQNGQYDFCWSVCALEHLGSIEHGMRFVEQSLKTLRPGGVAVHTTEFNYLSEDETVEQGRTVLYLRKHLETLAASLAAAGHRMLGPDFGVGDGPLDRFVDLPPYIEKQWLRMSSWGNVNQKGHLKLSLKGYPCTCYGIIVVKGR